MGIAPMSSNPRNTNGPSQASQLANPQQLAGVMRTTYIVYVILRTLPNVPSATILRQSYQSRAQALEALAREYRIWSTKRLYPSRLTDAQLKTPYLTNSMEVNKRNRTFVEEFGLGNGRHARGKVELILVHKDDGALEDTDLEKRTCTVVCEEMLLKRT